MIKVKHQSQEPQRLVLHSSVLNCRKNTDILFLGIRPQDLAQLKTPAQCPSLVVSMMAGVSCEEISGHFPDAQVVRFMPNTPCEFGAGITPVYYAGQNNHYYQSFIEAAQSLGELFFVDSEQKIDAATGISGGGPAYMMIIADAMIKACRENGASTNISQDGWLA